MATLMVKVMMSLSRSQPDNRLSTSTAGSSTVIGTSSVSVMGPVGVVPVAVATLMKVPVIPDATVTAKGAQPKAI